MRVRFYLLGFVLSFTALGRETLPFPDRATSSDLARVANRFIAMGEREAVAAITRLCDGARLDGAMREQVGWLCRLLFIRDKTKAIRAPLFGALPFPPDGSALDAWPSFPPVESEGVFFVLTHGYVLAGEPEPPEVYLRLCRQEGVFRTEELKIPTSAEGREAIKRIVASAAWRRIHWPDFRLNGPGLWWDRSEAAKIAFLESQIPQKG